jgi:predicted DNA-binding WGR domain protein
VRTFTYVSGTSSKFWEVDQDGANVTVRFGRIGTNGQSKTKELGSEAEARAHAEKLISEKVAKGYVEEGGTTPPPAPPAPAKPKAKKAAPASVADQASPEADEDTWEVPATWSRQAQPWRGLIPAKPPVPDHGAAELAAATYRGVQRAIDAALDHGSSDPELAAAARRHRGTARTLLRKARREPTPLGAAVLDAIANGWLNYSQERERLALLDARVEEYGLPFVTQAVMHMQTIDVLAARPGHHAYALPGATEVAVTRTDGARSHHAGLVLGRLRAFLAAAPDAEYAAAVMAAAETRALGLQARVASSYLFPTEQAWVSADIAELASAGQQERNRATLLWASVASVAQADGLLAVGFPYGLGYQTSLLYTAVTVLGPDATDLLVALFDGNGDAAGKKRVLAMLGQLPTDKAFSALVQRIDEKYVAGALLEPMARFPRRAARVLAQAAATKPAAKELLRGHLISNPGLAEDVAASEPSVASVVEGLAKRLVRVEDAANDAVPEVLLSPPWEARARRAKPTVLSLAPRGTTRLDWKPGEQAEWAAVQSGRVWKPPHQRWPDFLAGALDGWGQVQALAAAPEELVRPLLGKPGLEPGYPYDALDPLRKLLAVYGEAAIPYVTRVVRQRPTSNAPALLPLSGPWMAEAIAGWYVRSKPLRSFALTWLKRHAETAARDLLPMALGKPGKDRVAAESALRVLDRSVVLKAAREYGAEEAAVAVLDVDPLRLLPAKMPAFPTWLDVGHLPQVLVAGKSGALPREAVRNLVLMLMLCKPGETYGGVPLVKEACDPASLAEWAWAVFERWRAADYPARDGWVLEALALLGDDEVVRRLAPLVRAWPGEAAHARAVAGLDVLSSIGSDVALMHLHRIAEKASFKGLRTKAQERIAQVADDLGLTAEQLADRLVPDLGLDERGTMLLDYGARRFTVGFDEQLKPTVIDEDGSRRAVLPKPSAKDDLELAPAAYARFSALKKDVKTIAQDQVRRLERAMVAGRTWTAEEHRSLFVEHPLVWHLARRLLWRTADGTSFRVAEDRSLASGTDDELTIPPDVAVSLAHPLHLGESELRAWSEVFADYEILQPFPQLAREVYRLDAAEKEAEDLTRYHLAGVPTGRVLGLTAKGWVRGDVMDGGVSGDTYRHVGGDHYVVLDLNPGIIVGTPMEWPEQKIVKVYVSKGRPEWGSGGQPVTFGALDDGAASELIRDLEALKG